MAGPNCNLYFARRGLLPSGGTTSTFQSAWSFLSRSATSWIRPSWKSWTDERKVTATMSSPAYRSATHKVCARRRGRKTMGPACLPDRMRFLVASEGDEAGVHQQEELLGSWTRVEPFGGRAAWRLRDMILVTIAELHLDRDHLDRDLESS